MNSRMNATICTRRNPSPVIRLERFSDERFSPGKRSDRYETS